MIFQISSEMRPGIERFKSKIAKHGTKELYDQFNNNNNFFEDHIIKYHFNNIFTRNIYIETYFSRLFYTIFERYRKGHTGHTE